MPRYTSYLLPSQTGEGLDDVAVVCALQRAGNAMGRTREFLDVPLFKTLFKESQAVRARDVQRRRGLVGMPGCVASRSLLAR